MKGLTIGQVLGIHPLYSPLKLTYQYKSKLYGDWRDCESEWDKNIYSKYGYETREVYKGKG